MYEQKYFSCHFDAKKNFFFNKNRKKKFPFLKKYRMGGDEMRLERCPLLYGRFLLHSKICNLRIFWFCCVCCIEWTCNEGRTKMKQQQQQNRERKKKTFFLHKEHFHFLLFRIFVLWFTSKFSWQLVENCFLVL